MFSRKHQKNTSVDAQAQQQQSFAPNNAQAPAPTNITIQIPHPQDMAHGAQPQVQSLPQQHQQPMMGGGGGGGFAPAGQQFQTADGQTRQFGGAGHGPAPMFEQQQHARHNHAGLGAGAGAGMAAAPNTGNVSGHTGTLHRGAGAMGTSERNGLPNPMNVQAAPEGGVSVDGRAGLPLGRPTVGDKMVGKMEQGMGKMVGDWKMQNQGELRATGGKAAAAGQARAPIQ